MSESEPDLPDEVVYIAGAAVIVVPHMLLVVSVAWLAGYPGFNPWWLGNVVAPATVTMIVVVAAFGWSRDWSRAKSGVGGGE